MRGIPKLLFPSALVIQARLDERLQRVEAVPQVEQRVRQKPDAEAGGCDVDDVHVRNGRTTRLLRTRLTPRRFVRAPGTASAEDAGRAGPATVLALGRAMAQGCEVAAKHCIKRVWRFLRNGDVELEAVYSALFHAVAPCEGPIVVLADWTDIAPFQQLMLSLPRDGRALPFLSLTVPKGTYSGEQDGSMLFAEVRALSILRRLCPPGRQVIIVGDRGFGHGRWLWDVRCRGFDFVQRLPGNRELEVEGYAGFLSELGIPSATPSTDWGWGTLVGHEQLDLRLVTTFAQDAKEPWHLVTNLRTAPPAEVVRIYKRRMWIEAMFRDLKNRNWGLGMDEVRLSEPRRHDVHFLILALAYAFLCAFGAVAESIGVDKMWKANTNPERVMTLARIGNYFIQIANCSIQFALATLATLPS